MGSDIKIEPKDQVLIEHVTLHVLKVNETPYDLYSLDTTHSEFYQNFDYVLANLYYQKLHGKMLLGYIKKERKKSPVYYGPNYYRKRAIDYLAKQFTSTDKYALANTIVRLIEAAMLKVIAPQVPRWETWISSRKSRVPTYEQLIHVGIAPDLKLKKYRTLFFQTEWDRFTSENLIKFENEISEKQRQVVSAKNLLSLINWAENMKSELEGSASSKALLVKQKRLTLASRLKTKDKTLSTLAKEGTQFSTDRIYFTPFFIVASGKNFTEGEMLSRVKPVDNEGHVAFDNTDNLVPSALNAAGIEYCKAISY
jgi:hypothetical protein